jgi:hypothetical protein
MAAAQKTNGTKTLRAILAFLYKAEARPSRHDAILAMPAELGRTMEKAKHAHHPDQPLRDARDGRAGPRRLEAAGDRHGFAGANNPDARPWRVLERTLRLVAQHRRSARPHLQHHRIGRPAGSRPMVEPSGDDGTGRPVRTTGGKPSGHTVTTLAAKLLARRILPAAIHPWRTRIKSMICVARRPRIRFPVARRLL